MGAFFLNDSREMRLASEDTARRPLKFSSSASPRRSELRGWLAKQEGAKKKGDSYWVAL